MPVKFQDYYETLGVSRTATQEEINKAYRRLARKFHPDVNKEKGAEDQFKIINEAYEVLKDPDKRKRYDALGANWKAGQDFQPPPGWGGFDFGQGGPFGGQRRSTRRGPQQQPEQPFDFSGMSGGNFSDFFEALFGGRGGFSGSAPGMGGFDFGGMGGQATVNQPQHHEAEIKIPLEDAYHGAMREITFQDAAGNSRKYSVKIPAGISDGAKIRLAGQGGKGMNGAAGDMILTVKIEPHPKFRLKGHDLEVDVPVSPWEAALGIKAQVQTLDGPVTMSIPHGTNGGRRLRLRGKGLPKRGGERGDLYATVQVVVPRELTQREKELFEELQKVSSFDPRK